MLQEIQTALPGLTVVGMTSHNNVFNHTDNISTDTTFSLLCFEESSFRIVLSDLAKISEHRAALDIVECLKDAEDVKGIFMLSSGSPDHQVIMDRILRENREAVVFGATAAVKNYAMQESASFLIMNDRIYRRAVLCVIFQGKDLHIKADEEFGWTAIGKKMTVTRADGKNTVQEIDGSPAANIYEKYLGLRSEQISVENVCEFPVFKKEGERAVARISVGADEDGAIQLGAPLYAGDEIRFSYGNPEEIMQTTKCHAEKLLSFGTQALFLVVCMNRIIFLGEEQEKEIGFFREIFSDPVVIHGNSELFKDKTGGGELNSAMVYIAMREGEAIHNQETVSDENKMWHGKQSEDDIQIPLARRLLTFLDVTTGELEELQQNLSEEVAKKTQEIIRQQDRLNQINRQIVMTLSNAIDAKDAYTNGHSRRVAEYAKEIARRYGYDERRQEDVYMIGLLHDVGKIGIPDAIINKPGRLDDEEFAVIKTHPAIGAEILSSITEFPEISQGAHWHHERYDGHGYPDGLKGDEIPEIAQIISVADAYDAMTSNRSYRKVMEQGKVRQEIEKGKGTQFAPKFADIMLVMIDEDTGYQMRGRN